MNDTLKNYTVIPFDSTMQWVFEKPVKAAQLSESEIREVERLLDSAVMEWNHSLDTGKVDNGFLIVRSLNGYKRQFVAVTNEKGEKEVWVNCFCNDEIDYWQDDIVVVYDGGSCYFNVKINLAARTSYGFMVNGEA